MCVFCVCLFMSVLTAGTSSVCDLAVNNGRVHGI